MAAKRAPRKSNRVPVGGNRTKLAVPEALKDPDFSYRWVNDVPGNIRRYQDAGYEIVENTDMEVGDPGIEHSRLPETAVVKQAGRTRDSEQTPTVLMRIHKDYYKEDQEAKQREIDEVETSMFRNNKDQEGFYEKEHKQNRS